MRTGTTTGVDEMNAKSKYGKLVALLAAVILAAPVFAGPPAFSSGNGGGGRGKSEMSRGLRSSGGGSHQGRSTQYRGTGGSRGGSSNTPILDALRNGSGSNTPILDALRGNAGNNRGYGNGNALRELGRLADDYRYENDRREREEDYYKLERDRMIAGAVVNVVGMIAATQAQRYQTQVYAPAPAYTPAPCAPVYAPAPVCVPPRGHYETRREMVCDGHYAEVQVWVPDYRDPATGAIVVGHYETHRNWVAPVYRETQVWVQY